MTPKYNTRRAFVSLLAPSLLRVRRKVGDWVQFDSDYSGGDGVHFFSPQVSTLEDTNYDKEGYC